jgi:hypothetical protein
MKYCYKCGSELKGAKRFCMVCGIEQKKTIDDKVSQVKDEPIEPKGDEDSGECVRCGEDTEKTCFFCNVHVCRDHYTRMQANVNSYVTMKQYLNEEDAKRINDGWRGFMVYSCPKCLRLKVGKKLSDDETNTISTVDECSWYKLENQTI